MKMLLYPFKFIYCYFKYAFDYKYDSKLDKFVQMIIRKGRGVCAIRNYEVFHIKGHFYGIHNSAIYDELDAPCSRVADFQTLENFDWKGTIYYKNTRPSLVTILRYLNWKNTYYKSRLSIQVSAKDFENARTIVDLLMLIEDKQSQPEDFLDEMLIENEK